MTSRKLISFKDKGSSSDLQTAADTILKTWLDQKLSKSKVYELIKSTADRTGLDRKALFLTLQEEINKWRASKPKRTEALTESSAKKLFKADLGYIKLNQRHPCPAWEVLETFELAFFPEILATNMVGLKDIEICLQAMKDQRISEISKAIILGTIVRVLKREQEHINTPLANAILRLLQGQELGFYDMAGEWVKVDVQADVQQLLQDRLFSRLVS